MTQQYDIDTARQSLPVGEVGHQPETVLSAGGKYNFGIWKKVAWGSTFLVSAIASTTVGIVLGLTVPWPHHLSEQEQSTSIADLWRKGIRHQLVRPVNILVLGIDQVPAAQREAARNHTNSKTNSVNQASPLEMPSDYSLESDQEVDLDRLAGRSDTMLLVQLNPDESTVNILSIPRDTQVQFPGEVGVTKINHANLVGGPRLAADVVSDNLGGVEIDRYVRFNTAAFRELVDAVGGVEVMVPSPMKYKDQTQGLYIDLEAGNQVLTGDEAEQFARFRSDAFGDIGRVQRQQQLLGALRDRLMSPSVIPRIPSLLQLLRAHIDTNLTPEELLAILNFSLDMDRDAFRMVMLPGSFSQSEYMASYWLMDRLAVNEVMEDYFHIQPSQLVAQADIDQSHDLSENSDRDLKSLRIAVQNASIDPSATTKLIRHLQRQGFNQVYAVNSLSEPQQDTQIIVQRGNLRGAKLLRRNVGQGSIVSASIGDLYSDLTIRIGDDWQQPED